MSPKSEFIKPIYVQVHNNFVLLKKVDIFIMHFSFLVGNIASFGKKPRLHAGLFQFVWQTRIKKPLWSCPVLKAYWSYICANIKILVRKKVQTVLIQISTLETSVCSVCNLRYFVTSIHINLILFIKGGVEREFLLYFSWFQINFCFPIKCRTLPVHWFIWHCTILIEFCFYIVSS